MRHIPIALCSFFLGTAQGAYDIQDLDDFSQCLDDAQITCRSLANDQESVCCKNDNEIAKGKCISNEEDYFCALSYNSLNPFASPYQSAYCGTQSSRIQMHPQTRNTLLVDIANYLFVDQSICYYQFFADSDFLDFEKNTYEWVIEFQQLRNVNTIIGNGASLKTTFDAEEVTSTQTYKFEGGDSIFLAFTGVKPSRKMDDPGFTFKVDLKTIPKPTVEAIDYSVATFEEAAEVDTELDDEESSSFLPVLTVALAVLILLMVIVLVFFLCCRTPSKQAVPVGPDKSRNTQLDAVAKPAQR